MDGLISPIQTLSVDHSSGAIPASHKFTAVTRRLGIRPPQLDDCRALGELLPDPPACLSEWSVPTSPKRAEARVVRIQEKMRTGAGLGLIVFARSSGKPVGWFEFKCLPNRERVAKVGFWLSRDFRGMGLGVEAGCAAIPVGIEFLNLRMLRANVASDNRAAIQMLRRLGLKPAGKGPLPYPDSRTINFSKDLTGIV